MIRDFIPYYGGIDLDIFPFGKQHPEGNPIVCWQRAWDKEWEQWHGVLVIDD